MLEESLSLSDPKKRSGRLLVVSNRLPFSVQRSPEGDVKLVPSSGGLVSALSGYLESRKPEQPELEFNWAGWAGADLTPEETEQLRTSALDRQGGYPLTLDGAETELTIGGAVTPQVDARIDCGLAGTVLRFVPPVAALGSQPVTFDGDEQARARPIAPLLDALRGLGVALDGNGLPFRVSGTGSVAGGTVEIDASGRAVVPEPV
jgi:hypothetical protein